MAGESSRDQCAKECNGCSTCSSSPYEYSQPKETTVTVFKTQQEIFNYLDNGGAVVYIDGTILKFVDGALAHDMTFSRVEHWKRHIEPVAKTKVWRWEWITVDSDGDYYVYQRSNYFSEKYAAKNLPGYTKAPGSEREI